MTGEKEDSGKRAQQKKKNRIRTMDLILVIVFICLVAFTVTMIWLFTVCGSVPDTLITCVFAALAGECGVMGWIKTTKDKQQDRRWKKQDEKQARDEP